MTADSVDGARAAPHGHVPESAALDHRTVAFGVQAVVSVIRGEHPADVVTECITGVTQVSRHEAKLVVM